MSRRSISLGEEKIKKLEHELAERTTQIKQLKSSLSLSENTLKNIEKQLEEANSQLNKKNETLKSLDRDNEELRSIKNQVTFERDSLRMIKTNNDAELERLRVEVSDLTAQLKKAIDGKCEALSKSDEILSKAALMEQKEQRLEQEKIHLDNQIRNLTSDLNKYAADIQRMQIAHNSKITTLDTELADKSEKLKIAQDNVTRLSEDNVRLIAENNKLNSSSVDVDMESEIIRNFKKELDAKTKLSEMYLSMLNDTNLKCEELAAQIVQLRTTNESLASLNAKYNAESSSIQSNFEKTLVDNERTISSLQTELNEVNAQLKTLKEGNLKVFLEDLSPSAATTCNLIKNKSLTQIYDEIVKLCDELSSVKKDNSIQAQTVASLRSDVEEKDQIINRKTVDYNDVVDRNKSIAAQYDVVSADLNKLRESYNDSLKRLNNLEFENSSAKNEINDLSRQVCFLLQKVEERKLESEAPSENLSKELVTFSDIQELQANNAILLKSVKELKNKLKRYKDCSDLDENKPTIDMLNKRIEDLTQSQSHQIKIIDGLNALVERYKKLYLESDQKAKDSLTVVEPVVEEDTADPKTNKQVLLEIELVELKKRFNFQKEEFDKYRIEMTTNEKILNDQLDDVRSKLNDLNTAYIKCASTLKTTTEKHEILQRNVDIYKRQILSLEDRNKIYDSSIMKQEQTIKFLRDEIMTNITKLSKAEVQLENSRQECKFLKDSEIRLKKERDLLRKERYSQSLFNNDIEYLKVSQERKENEDRISLESRLTASNKLSADLQKQIKAEQDKYNEAVSNFECQIKHLENGLKESNKSLADKKNDIVLIQQQLDDKSATIEDLNKRIVNLITFSSHESTMDTPKRVRDLQNQIQSRQSQIDSLQKQLSDVKESSRELQNKFETVNNQYIKLQGEYDEYKNSSEKNLRELQESGNLLKDKALKLESKIKLQSQDIDSMDTDDVKSELSKTRVLLETVTSERDDKYECLRRAEDEVARLTKMVQTSEEKYAHELHLHSKDVESLKTYRVEITRLTDQVKQLQAVRERNEADLSKLRTNLNTQEKDMICDYQEMKSNVSELKNQNMILHERLQIDSTKSDDDLVSVIKYLRQEKNILETKFESVNAENIRLKIEVDAFEKQIVKLKRCVESNSRSMNQSQTITDSSEISNMEALHALTDSNVMLRQERDGLSKQVKEMSERLLQAEERLMTATESVADLSKKFDATQAENNNLKLEIGRWRTRVSALVEKANKSGPEDWKRLQNERETLAKKLTAEKENIKKLSDELLTLKIEKTRVDEEISTLNQTVKSLTEDKDKQVVDLNTVRNDMSRITQELLEAKNSLSEKIEENSKLGKTLSTAEANVIKLNERDLQLRNMARKYKTQYEALVKSNETGSAPNSEKLDTRIAELEEQLAVVNQRNTGLQSEIESLRATSDSPLELQNARNHVIQLETINSNLTKELNDVKSIRDENSAQYNTLKTQYEDLALRYQNEELERRNDILSKDRKIELLLQRITLLENDSNLSKPSTSSSHIEKTAEIRTDITSTLGSTNIIENLPSSSSTVTRFQHMRSLPPESTQDEIVSEDSPPQTVDTVQNAAPTTSSPRKDPTLEAKRDLQQQASSSSNNNNSNSTVTTSHGNDDMEISQISQKRTRQMVEQSTRTPKRLKIQSADDVDLEYEVPTSSQRDQEDDCGDSGDDQYQENSGGPTNVDKTQGSANTEAQTERINPDRTAATTDDNEVEVIENASQIMEGINVEQISRSPLREQQIETISSVTGGSSNDRSFMTLAVVAGSVASGSGSAYDEANDSIVPSTPVLYVPRRNDGFGEAVSSPVTTGRIGEGCFTFSEMLAGPSSAAIEDTHPDLASQIPANISDNQDQVCETNEEGGLKIDEPSEVSVNETPDEEVPTVSSQSSQPASPRQMDEGSEAEATTPVIRNTPTRSNWRRARAQSSNTRAEYNTRAYSQRAFRGTRGNRRPQNQYRRN